MTTSTNASPKAAAAPPSSFPGSTNLGPPLAASRRPRRPSPQSWTPRPPRRPPFRRPQRPTTAPQAHLLRTLLRSRPTPPVVLFLSLLPLCTAHVPPDSGATTPPILPNRLPTPVSLCPNPFPSASLGTAPISLSSATATTFTSPNAAGPLHRSEPDHGVFHFLVEPTSDHAAPDLPRALPSPACPFHYDATTRSDGNTFPTSDGAVHPTFPFGQTAPRDAAREPAATASVVPEQPTGSAPAPALSGGLYIISTD